MDNLEPRYDHRAIEDRIYERWEKSDYFNPDNLPISKAAKPFTIIMPPPNANGSLHVGHAVFVTLQDILTRFWRMRGRQALWLPGADHAGFETQVVYDKKLDKEGRNRFQIPREELWKEIWNFTQENKKIMETQLRKLGASCDWSREKFTLDPNIIKEVQNTFIKMHKEGLIYRGERIINWCTKHQTSLSDIENQFREQKDNFYYLKYGPFTIGTARPETKFGDKYVVIHPADARYKKYREGEKINLEWINGPITATIIKDKAIDMKFGTGVMTITPWHDAIDFDIAERHGLEKEQIIDLHGKLMPVAGEFAGMKISDARPKIVEKLKERGLLEKVEEDYSHNIRVCYKCNTSIEPQIRKQWFIKMEKLAANATKAVKQGKIKFYPESAKKIYFHWLRDIRDWNISRQIAWGIRIPAWFKTKVGTEFEAAHFKSVSFCKKINIEQKERDSKLFEIGVRWMGSNTEDIIQFDQWSMQKLKDLNLIDDDWINSNKIKQSNAPGEIFVGEKPPNSIGWIQDPDVFDTWFSSGQWPFLTLQTSKPGDFKKFYPTDVMETGHDILFFWVARMIMLGLYRTGKVPFKAVYLHGLVRDKDRQKMSKSKGNVIDPLGVAEIYGTDALRMALVVGNTPGSDIIISEEKIRGYRNFATKVWNIARFVLMNKPEMVNKQNTKDSRNQSTKKLTLTAEDKKNLKELAKVKSEITKHIEKFEFHLASEKIYHYIWHEFADKIIENYKPRLLQTTQEPSPPISADNIAAYQTLKTILAESLKMLHPFMPFITEEIYGKLHPGKLLMIEKWLNPAR
ncbi:MAG: hypothetical protein A3B25_01735 [Candidatus Ryanbacteria bacterium RIFCSPLOWO2_01_FULL_48_26]|uniref:valine--tRNA ligase n=1 Tax=Candidatus Ryanbacteria bacterium RIFCSPLOWO2_01_FULL_48_26 TaxID=1802126 RepID=A0A1G2GVY1_9BACT|nr:MAG: hypothetical protein A3B25_01735 [Candidatus Ryanbacteria bacterium RIFCSPLOWO2_01_FULL_48_26]